MDNLVLTRLAFDLAAELPGTLFEEIRQETGERFRLIFAQGDRITSLVVSIHPERPWIGRPAFRWEGPRWSPDPIAVAIGKRLAGRRVERVTKAPADRSVRIEWAAGRGLVCELAPHRANLVLLGDEGIVEAIARPGKRAVARLATGSGWSPAERPQGWFDPFPASVEQLEERIASHGGAELAGVSAADFELVRDEAARRHAPCGSVLRERLDEVLNGTSEIAIEGPGDPRTAIRTGTFWPPAFRLFPWRPASPDTVVTEPTAAETVGLFHDGIDTVARFRARLGGLAGILRSELRRTRSTLRRVEAELDGFRDPEQVQRMGEALLAGLGTARRSGDTVFVADPYDADGAELAVPAPRGTPLSAVANDLFKRVRRARRGREATASRKTSLSARAARLESLIATSDAMTTAGDADALEAAMRVEGLAVGLERATRAGRAAERLAAPRLAGVRVLTSAEGWTILVGRTGKDNDRLTFKLAAPEDVWLHAADVSGAHVVIRNPERAADIPESTLREAARAAAWFSDGRSSTFVDVHWARRKHVRRAAGGTPGRVTLKRFQTLRVRAEPPPGADGP